MQCDQTIGIEIIAGALAAVSRLVAHWQRDVRLLEKDLKHGGNEVQRRDLGVGDHASALVRDIGVIAGVARLDPFIRSLRALLPEGNAAVLARSTALNSYFGGACAVTQAGTSDSPA